MPTWCCRAMTFALWSAGKASSCCGVRSIICLMSTASEEIQMQLRSVLLGRQQISPGLLLKVNAQSINPCIALPRCNRASL